MMEIHSIVETAASGQRLEEPQALALAQVDDIAELCAVASALRDAGHGHLVTWSPKVFIPLTRLCRDVCHYCTFARTPRSDMSAYMLPDEVIAIARAGEAAGCHEALFTLGDRPEARYRHAREALASLGHRTTLEYLRAMCEAVLAQTSLLPHVNPGVMSFEETMALRPVAVSQGLMLESTSERLCRRGGPHFGSPDKQPAVRLAAIEAAGRASIPFTTGILIGIGETRRERIESLLAIRRLHERYGHIQEVIVQSFRPKPDTMMASTPAAGHEELCWTLAVARIVLGPAMHIQAPPNLSPGRLADLLGAGVDDWGGVSPVTRDHVNPEAPWPNLERLRCVTEAAGKVLAARLAVHPEYAREPACWLDTGLRPRILRAVDASMLARENGWIAGVSAEVPAATGAPAASAHPSGQALSRVLQRARDGRRLNEEEIVTLLDARGPAFSAVVAAADALRREVCGERVTYVVNRNINYTNVCCFKCRFCAFSKGRLSENLRGRPYELDEDEIRRRVHEAWSRGATEVCMQGGIHPDYNGTTYLRILRAAKEAVPGIHVHAFSPLEVWEGARTLAIPLADYLARLRDAGLGTLPGTAAEILDDEVRAAICPDKITANQWEQVMETAHGTGLRTTATIMFGHVERPAHVARHLLRLRDLQARTGGFTEFVPLPFVAVEAPIYLRGGARSGPTFREAVLMHAVARLALHPLISSIQASWVKLGPRGAQICLNAGANDLGGTLMNESITRAAGAMHGQEMPPENMDALIQEIGRQSAQRTTLYTSPAPERVAASYAAPPLADTVDGPVRTRRGRTTRATADLAR